MLIDRLGTPKHTVAIGIILVIVSGLCLCFWTTVTGFFIHGFLSGFGVGAIINGLSYLTLQNQGKESGGKSYAKTRIFGSGGYIVALLFASLIFKYTDSSYLFCFFTGLGLLVLDFIVVSLAPVNKAVLGGQKGSWKRLFFQKSLFVFCFSWLLASFATPLNMTLMANYVKSLGGSKSLISGLFAFQGIIALITLPIVGTLADKFNLKILILFALAGPGLRSFAQSFVTDPEWMFAVQFLHILTFVIPEICCLLYARSLVKPVHHATAVGLYSSFRVVGILISSSLCGYLIDHQGYIFTQRLMGYFSFSGVLLFACTLFWGNRKNKTAKSP
jgi:PPP family 3-phenylpropionic acid transporter